MKVLIHAYLSKILLGFKIHLPYKIKKKVINQTDFLIHSVFEKVTKFFHVSEIFFKFWIIEFFMMNFSFFYKVKSIYTVLFLIFV